MDFFIKHWIQDRINVLYILDKKWVSESNGTLQMLHERVILERSFLDFPIGVVIQHELDCLVWRVDDERVSVEFLEDDGVLNT